MKKTRFSLYGIMAMFIVMIMLSACSGSLDSQWIQTTDGALFWASPADTTMSYSWEGETFDSIANGKGTLSKIYGTQNEAYMSRSAEKWVRGLCFNELGVGG